jgi:hypothetical protein
MQHLLLISESIGVRLTRYDEVIVSTQETMIILKPEEYPQNSKDLHSFHDNNGHVLPSKRYGKICRTYLGWMARTLAVFVLFLLVVMADLWYSNTNTIAVESVDILIRDEKIRLLTKIDSINTGHFLDVKVTDDL